MQAGGLSGLGYLGVLYAVLSWARTSDIDSTGDTAVADTLQSLGGATAAPATAADSDAIAATMDGLRHRGEGLDVLGHELRGCQEPLPVGRRADDASTSDLVEAGGEGEVAGDP